MCDYQVVNRKIAIVLCYARSGGTLLNKYLANIDNVVILSEAHPIHNKKGGIHSIKTQAKEWYGINVLSDDYVEQVCEIKKWCDKNNRYLIIRDWSYIDFSKSNLNGENPPISSTNIKILESQFELNKIAFVRDGVDVFLSQDKAVKVFSQEYLSFIKYLKNNSITIFKYENFVSSPADQLSKILKSLDISPVNKVSESGSNVQNVVGDTGLSRGNKNNRAIKIKRRYGWWLRRYQINNDRDLRLANLLLDYPQGYESRECESIGKHCIFLLKVGIYQYIRRIAKYASKIIK